MRVFTPVLRNGKYAMMPVEILIMRIVRFLLIMHFYVNCAHNLSRNVQLCTTNKRLDLEAPIFEHVSMLTIYLRLPIVIQIVVSLGLHFQGPKFESNTLTNA